MHKNKTDEKRRIPGNCRSYPPGNSRHDSDAGNDTNALAEHFNSSRQAVSKHIKVLVECQLVKQQQSGREIYYHFNPKKLKEVDKWLAQFRVMWENKFNQLDDVLKHLKNKKS